MSNEQLKQGGELIATPPGIPERQGKCRNFGPLMLCDAIFCDMIYRAVPCEEGELRLTG
jgi:hypothetical protein